MDIQSTQNYQVGILRKIKKLGKQPTCPTAETRLFYHISNTVSPSYHQLKVLFFQQNYFTFVFLLDLTIKQRLSL
jgi:hypothetical protein